METPKTSIEVGKVDVHHREASREKGNMSFEIQELNLRQGISICIYILITISIESESPFSVLSIRKKNDG